MTTTPLPPLPTPKGKVYFEAEPYQPAWVSSSDAFDDEQMQAYATQARADLEAENKRLREALETIYEAVGIYTLADASDCAAAALKDTK